jgi:hypothetical protein
MFKTADSLSLTGCFMCVTEKTQSVPDVVSQTFYTSVINFRRVRKIAKNGC